jgi:hypothetical protein
MVAVFAVSEHNQRWQEQNASNAEFVEFREAWIYRGERAGSKRLALKSSLLLSVDYCCPAGWSTLKMFNFHGWNEAI